MASFRVVNVTNQIQAPGFFLDFGEKASKILGAGKHTVLQAENYDTLPEFIHEWVDKGYAKVYSAADNTQISGTVSGEITPSQVSPVREMSGEDLPHLDDFMEDEPDLEVAREAALPISQSTAQMRPKARVSLGQESENYSAQDGLSPIPGDRPVAVDNSEAFTIKAKGGRHVGGVIK